MAYSNTLGLTLPTVTSSALQTVDPEQAFRGDQGASTLLGQLSRAQWEDWKTRYSPYIQTLADAAQNPTAAADAAAMASNSMTTAFDNSQQGLAMQRQGMGVQQTAAQQAADTRRQALNKAASSVSAGNQARISAVDRQQAILGGGLGLSNIPDQVMNQ
ncbi:hypothetical protein [Salinicola peritrichatus]|uniref:hypothetical protein n=1 Tax=Salinicola peritrichatus TaxID=1267424 RepID=UPI0019550AE0|nr:hypothetical protein [Salinicola peritrichatus]